MSCGEGHCWVRLQGLECANRTMIQKLQQVEQFSKADWLGGQDLGMRTAKGSEDHLHAVSAGLAAAGVVVPLGSLVDPGLAGSLGQTDDQQRLFVAQGDQIIAVQYRKVCFKWFSGKTADKATLAKKTQWERYDRPRYLHSDGDDMVEVDLEDDGIGGGREKYIVGSEEIIFSAQLHNDEED